MRQVQFCIIFVLIFLSSVLNASSIHSSTIQWGLSHPRVKQGQAIKVELKSYTPIQKASITFNEKKFPLYAVPKAHQPHLYHYATYLGISRYARPLNYLIDLRLTFKNGKTSHQQKTLTVLVNDEFRDEHIKLNKSNNQLSKNTEALASDNKKLAGLFSKKTPRLMINGPFIKPVPNGRMTSAFGRRRIYNGRPSWRHSGIDYGLREGAPILASNDGVVIDSGSYTIHGNSILIDHGMGIISIYNHLDRRLVKKGDFVKKGRQIGTMGSTGLSTGAHLHFGISVHNERTDPNVWINKTHLYD